MIRFMVQMVSGVVKMSTVSTEGDFVNIPYLDSKRYTLGETCIDSDRFHLLDNGLKTGATVRYEVIDNIYDACEITGGIFCTGTFYGGTFRGGQYLWDGPVCGSKFTGHVHDINEYYSGESAK